MLKEEKDRERWLPVVGQEGFYEVSDLGRIRSLDRWVKTRHGGRFSAKLSLSDIVEIREALALGEARRDLATEFGVCRQMIDQIALRQTYFYV